jgi:hypothetical protein
MPIQEPPKPDPDTYWVVPGQVLAGEYPGARDPEEAGKKLRRFLQVGVRQSELVRDRYRGALLGLAVGDALGTTVEFKAPGTFPPVTDISGGGHFNLKPGEWTDDTSMALCLAESLIDSTPKIKWTVTVDGMNRAISAATEDVSILATQWRARWRGTAELVIRSPVPNHRILPATAN